MFCLKIENKLQKNGYPSFQRMLEFQKRKTKKESRLFTFSNLTLDAFKDWHVSVLPNCEPPLAKLTGIKGQFTHNHLCPFSKTRVFHLWSGRPILTILIGKYQSLSLIAVRTNQKIKLDNLGYVRLTVFRNKNTNFYL